MMLATPGATRMSPATGASHVSEVCDAFKMSFYHKPCVAVIRDIHRRERFSPCITADGCLSVFRHHVTDIVALSYTMAAY
jgi:hypothetical protein